MNHHYEPKPQRLVQEGARSHQLRVLPPQRRRGRGKEVCGSRGAAGLEELAWTHDSGCVSPLHATPSPGAHDLMSTP